MGSTLHQGWGPRVQGFGYRVQSSGCRAYGWRLKIQGNGKGYKAWAFVLKVPDLGFEVKRHSSSCLLRMCSQVP